MSAFSEALAAFGRIRANPAPDTEETTVAETPEEFCRWLLRLDDPEDVIGLEYRRTVTLDGIIKRARAALAVVA